MILKLLIEAKTREEQTVVINNTPAFYSYGSACMKITEAGTLYVEISEKSIRVITEKSFPEMIHLFFTKGTPITEEEFDEAYCKLNNEMAEIQLMKVDLITS